MTDVYRERETATVAAPPVNLCGDPKDSGEFLWDMARDCRERQIKAFWLVSLGVKGYLLVATDRIKGIECPDLVSGAYANNNYWQIAWQRGYDWFGQQAWGTIGLGVNAAHHRSHEQLHLHISKARQGTPGTVPGVKAQLDKAAKAGEIAKDWKGWPAHVIAVTGEDQSGNPQKRNYRAVHIDSFASINLFKALYDNVVVPGKTEKMEDQTMIVIEAGTGAADGFYLLNSSDKLPQGIGVCDSLLLCK